MVVSLRKPATSPPNTKQCNKKNTKVEILAHISLHPGLPYTNVDHLRNPSRLTRWYLLGNSSLITKDGFMERELRTRIVFQDGLHKSKSMTLSRWPWKVIDMNRWGIVCNIQGLINTRSMMLLGVRGHLYLSCYWSCAVYWTIIICYWRFCLRLTSIST